MLPNKILDEWRGMEDTTTPRLLSRNPGDLIPRRWGHKWKTQGGVKSATLDSTDAGTFAAVAGVQNYLAHVASVWGNVRDYVTVSVNVSKPATDAESIEHDFSFDHLIALREIHHKLPEESLHIKRIYYCIRCPCTAIKFATAL